MKLHPEHTGSRCTPWTMAILFVLVLLPLQSWAQMTSVGIDCSQIASLHIQRWDNLRGFIVLTECGVLPRTQPALSTRDADQEPSPPNILVSNRTCTGGSGDYCTKSESMVWHSTKAGDQTVVVNFNDLIAITGVQAAGTAYSTDDGATFTQIIPGPFNTGHGNNYGDPLLVYNQRLNLWFGGDLAECGIGLWSSPDGQNWSPASCPDSSTLDDRPSIWVDNNAFSARYGRMYVSYNNFAVGDGALFVTYSDDGNTWSTRLQLTSSFIRDVQLTGALPGPPPANAGHTSTVFLAAMDEGSGAFSQRQNIFFRSTDGGVTGPRST
jgi:hypothetical protein